MKKPQLYETSFLANAQCGFQGLAELLDQADGTDAERAVLADLGALDTDTLDPVWLDQQYGRLRGLAWGARSHIDRRRVLDTTLMWLDALRCVASSRAGTTKKADDEEPAAVVVPAKTR